MGKLKKSASNDRQPKPPTIHFVSVVDDNRFKQELSVIADDLAKSNGSAIDFDTLAAELKDVYLDGLVLINGGTPRRDYGNCNCTHPPSFGHCIFGACVTVFKYGLKITINI